MHGRIRKLSHKPGPGKEGVGDLRLSRIKKTCYPSRDLGGSEPQEHRKKLLETNFRIREVHIAQS